MDNQPRGTLQKNEQKPNAVTGQSVLARLRRLLIEPERTDNILERLNNPHSISWRGWAWRIEALRTGKSFAEVVLCHTLIYRVEQVFLIHKKSGLLLQHVAAGMVSTRDAEIVSGMLTAIQEAIRNFARDSFGSGREEPFEKIDFGDREVWFEAGPHAVLAVVILGHAPESFRNDLMKPAIEAIHFEMSETLDNFEILKEEFRLDPNKVISRWDRYLSLDPGFVRQRAINILKPPPSVHLKVENGMLFAAGSAPHIWIADAQRLAPAIPGVDGLDVSALIEEEIGSLRAKIDHQVYLFRTGSSLLLPGQKDKLNDLIPTIHELITLATAARKHLRIHLTGHTDSQGAEKTNLALSMSRAARISSLLAASGIDQDLIISAGVGAKESLRAEKDEADRTFNRSVSIKVSLKNPPQNERSK